MSEIVKTTGRPMTQRLADAIDGLPDRELSIRAFARLSAQGSRLDDLYAALAIELRLAALREQDTLLRAGREYSDSIPASPLPEATGPAVYMDPDTGDITELEP